MKRTWKIAVGLYLFAQVFFLSYVQFPTTLNFDEFHYIPAARQLIKFDTIPNREHPPLVKFFIAAGMGMLGDNPVGWRVMSTIFGALTLVGMFYWALALFEDEVFAIWVALITLVNQLLYVQSRIAMLDTFMFCFMAWGFAAFTSIWKAKLPEKIVRLRLKATGVLFGLATACKWFGLMGLLTCIGLVLIVSMMKIWGVKFTAPDSKVPMKTADWYQADFCKGVSFQDWVMYLGVIPVAVYFVTFIPYTFFNEGIPLWRIFSFQGDMYSDQLRVVGGHPYLSQWKDWPLLTRPIWYAFDSLPDSVHRCVCLLGNPLIMLGGLFALLICLIGLIYDRSREAFLILFFYLGMFGTWVVIPRKVEFYYYYYPAGMVLSLAMAYPFFILEKWGHKRPGLLPGLRFYRWIFLGFALGMFIYFFPILSGSKVYGEDFRKFMWFDSWI